MNDCSRGSLRTMASPRKPVKSPSTIFISVHCAEIKVKHVAFLTMGSLRKLNSRIGKMKCKNHSIDSRQLYFDFLSLMFILANASIYKVNGGIHASQSRLKFNTCLRPEDLSINF